jgi:hypothetical protein
MVLDEERQAARIIGRLIMLVIIGYAVYGGYGWLNSVGWIEHSHDTPIWIKGEWLVGEYRVCEMVRLPQQELPATAHLLCGQGENTTLDDLNPWTPGFVGSLSDHEFYGLMGGQWSAVEEHFHVIPVNYWGRIDRSDRKDVFFWRCQRNSDSLTCKALT